MRSFGESVLESPVDARFRVVIFFLSKPSNICSAVSGFKDPFDGRTQHTDGWMEGRILLLIATKERRLLGRII